MRYTLLRRYQGIIFGIGMFMTVLLASACAGVPTNTTTTGTSGTSAATTTTAGTTPGANQPTATQQTTTTFVPGNIQFIGSVNSVNSSTIVVQMPDGPLTMTITPQTDRSHFNGGLPTNGQLVKVETNAVNGGFTAMKLEQADQKDQTSQNIVQYQGVTTSAVGTDNTLHLGVGNKIWNFTINQSTDLSKVGNSAQSIQANQPIKVKVQFTGTNGTVLKVDTNSGNN
jgi:hypothetical protein